MRKPDAVSGYKTEMSFITEVLMTEVLMTEVSMTEVSYK